MNTTKNDFITAGNITKRLVKKFLFCLNKCDGDLRKSAQLADSKYDLNRAATQENNDSWYEAVAQYNELGGAND